jgi:enamine deaminase RidA (YjgF/YER057c/UK114 family)
MRAFRQLRRWQHAATHDRVVSLAHIRGRCARGWWTIPQVEVLHVEIEKRLEALGLVLPEPMKGPPGARLPFVNVRVWDGRAYVAGHAPLNSDGAIAEPRGKVGAEVSLDQGYVAARQTALAILGSLKRELGDLDRVAAWLRVFGMVNVAPGFNQPPAVINGFSDLILELYGEEAGRHARSAVGMAVLPFDIPVEIEAEVAIRS